MRMVPSTGFMWPNVNSLSMLKYAKRPKRLFLTYVVAQIYPQAHTASLSLLWTHRLSFQGIMYETSVFMEQKTCRGSSTGTACLPISLRVAPTQRRWTVWSCGIETRCWAKQRFRWTRHGCLQRRGNQAAAPAATVTALPMHKLLLIYWAKLVLQYRETKRRYSFIATVYKCICLFMKGLSNNIIVQTYLK